jgi:hypothetical protein
MAGEWWQMDLEQADWAIAHSVDVYFGASAINGKLGDLYNCSGNHVLSRYMSMTVAKHVEIDILCSLRLNSEFELQVLRKMDTS